MRGRLNAPDAPNYWQTTPPIRSHPLLPPGLIFSDTPSRIWALLLDGFVVGTINAVIFPLVGLDYTAVGYGSFPDRAVYVIATLVGALVTAVYLVWFWSGGRRATPGQRAFGIQVANAFDGQPLTVSQAVRRYVGLGYWVVLPIVLPYRFAAIFGVVAMALWYLVLLVSTIISPTKQGIHDWFGRSAVVRPARAGTGWSAGCLALTLLLAVPYVVLIAWSFLVTADYMPDNPGIQAMREYLEWLWPS